MERVRSSTPSPERRAVRVRGLVQGVGFRPAVFRLATALELAGFVRNDAEGVWIELEGAREVIEDFLARLPHAAPPKARIDSVHVSTLPPLGEQAFHIAASASGGDSRAVVPSDTAPCEACLDELFDPQDRRYRYPFINCTGCGPRYTLVRDVPYDRARTTMAAFPLCDACRREYEDPRDRRFHAEPNACARCGPRLRLVTGEGVEFLADDALRSAAGLLLDGRIVAVKGVGGFLLACDATNDEAVRRLRERKHRPDKPFAVMARDLETARRVAVLDDAATVALLSPACPIVLAAAIPGTTLATSIAPNLQQIGLFLPSTPLQHLLLSDGPPLQVMTSGNVSEEPLARTDAEAFESLGGIADAFLLHDREIHTRVDDSVVRVIAGEPRVVRRARGYVPEVLPLPFDAPEVLAVGGELKNTVCFTRGREAFVSQHLGDLGQLKTFEVFGETVARMRRLLKIEPRVVAHDLHPDYDSTRWVAASSGLVSVAVQHHHAHVASCLVENGALGPVLGVAFDGTGCGPDGSLWGGEFLACDLLDFRRIGHLRALPLPGGEAAIREPWRLAAAALLDAGEPLDLLARIDASRLGAIVQLLHRDVSSPRATGAGRWFDAVSALCGVRDAVTYEAQAAMELEAICAPPENPYEYGLDARDGEPLVVDLRPTIRTIADDLRRGVPTSLIASRFHETLASAIAAACLSARTRTGDRRVALSGGCFQNRRLTERAKAWLEDAGFEVLLHRRVPPNDGGLSLGQAAVAACRVNSGRS